VHKHRNLLAHAPERLHEEITEDYNEMICAETPEEIEKHRKAFIRKWRLKHEAVANSQRPKNAVHQPRPVEIAHDLDSSI
jgi:putative transposase